MAKQAVKTSTPEEKVVEQLRLFMRDLNGSIHFHFYDAVMPQVRARANEIIKEVLSETVPSPQERMEQIHQAFDEWLKKADPHNLFATSHGFAREAWQDALLNAAPQADTPASPDEAQRTAGTTPSGTMPGGRRLPADSRSAVATKLVEHARQLESKLADEKRKLQYHKDAINRMASLVGALGETSESVVTKAISLLSATRESVIDECIAVCRKEYLEDPVKDTGDEDYDNAIKHCVDALHELKQSYVGEKK